MRTAIGLVILAAGAILTFAVSAQVPGINLRLAGLIIMVTGIAELIAPSRAAAWLRRRGPLHGEVREPPTDEPEDAGDLGDVAYPAYLLQDPAVLAAEVLNSARAPRAATASAATATMRSAGNWEA
jgi:hypothetical protein